MMTLDLLEADKNKGYLKWALPESRDFELMGFVSGWPATKEAGLKIDQRHVPTLLVFGERMASLAVRAAEPANATFGFGALAIAMEAADRRDLVIAISLLVRACQLIRCKPLAVVGALPDLLKRSIEPVVREFLMRDLADRSIEAMGYVESENSEGLVFLRTW